MEITFPVILSKELIYNKVREEEILEYYLGIPVKKGLFKSPLRNDNSPTCAFYRARNGRIIFKDFSGAFSGDAISVVMEKFQCSYMKALQIIANDFGIVKNENLKVNKPKMEYSGSILEENKTSIIQVEIRDFQDYELAWWKTYGITEKTLKHFRVFSCKNIWLNGTLFHLETSKQKIFGYFGGTKDGVENWKIYFPGKKKYKFISNWKATKIQGAAQLPKEGGEYLVITKSLKDCMTLYEFGITAIAPNSENLFVTPAQYEKLKTKFKNILIVYDNDLAGIHGLNKIRKEFPGTKVAFIPRKYEAKDISDFYKKYGREETQKLITTAKNFYFNG